MITIKLSADNPLVLSFDGEVLEVFRLSSSNRVHISLINNLELKTDKKGAHSLDINAIGGYVLQGNAVDENAFPKITKLIAEVQKAKAGFKFD
jgi:hypothetical protein